MPEISFYLNRDSGVDEFSDLKIPWNMVTFLLQKKIFETIKIILQEGISYTEQCILYFVYSCIWICIL